jgi:signal transduction histidine kinase
MGAVVDEVLALLRAVVPANIEIVRRGVEEADAPIVGETGLIHQLIMNLCTNAYQAMERDGGVMTVTLSREPGGLDARTLPGDYVVLEIRDTGEGMDEETRARIFEPFFTTREVGAGTGLGLSVVHGIATSMNATITVDSRLGAGARFRVYFPVFRRGDSKSAGAAVGERDPAAASADA